MSPAPATPRPATVLHVVGARPNFMKAAPVMAALAETAPGVRQVLVHTGQHYDDNMSDVFFRQLGMPRPDINLEVGSGTHAAQTAHIMLRVEPALLAQHPSLVVVYGDVNSTAACALVAVKLGIPIAHVEAGLRSFDRTMPEEINRLVTDQLADYCFITSPEAETHLLREGVAAGKIHFVGNTMIDTLARLVDLAVPPAGLALDGEHVLVTLHRPGTVDDDKVLGPLYKTLVELSRERPVVFPVHPRTRARLDRLGLGAPPNRLLMMPPLGYLEFLWLEKNARLVVTDSGGVQEETTWLGVPCLTFRDNTERPVTVTQGTNVLVGRDPDRLRAECTRALTTPRPTTRRPQGWDGHAGARIARVLAGILGSPPDPSHAKH